MNTYFVMEVSHFNSYRKGYALQAKDFKQACKIARDRYAYITSTGRLVKLGAFHE